MEPEKKIDEDVRYFVPGIDKGSALRGMARRCFADTFGHLFDSASFEQFLDEAYGDGGAMSKDLLDSAIKWFTAATGGHIIGYAKLRPLSALVPDPPKGALELQQIYVLRNWQGRGVAERLMHWALDRARALGAPRYILRFLITTSGRSASICDTGSLNMGIAPSNLEVRPMMTASGGRHYPSDSLATKGSKDKTEARLIHKRPLMPLRQNT